MRAVRGSRSRCSIGAIAQSLVATWALALGCAGSPTLEASTEPDPATEVVRSYRLYAEGDCAAVRARAREAADSGTTSLEPFFDLLRGFCLELEGRVEAASSATRASW